MDEPRKGALRLSPAAHGRAARLRGAAMTVGTPLLAAGLLLLALGDAVPVGVVLAVMGAGVAALTVSTPLTLLPIDVPLRPRPVEPPVRGRWQALNSPATKVPSHGTNGYGQTWAVDLLFEPHEGARPEPRGLGFDPPERFPTFGQDVLAVADGVVVRMLASARDHRCRARWPAYPYLFVEGFLRELLGARFMLGNHVVVQHDDGAYSVVAHLERGSPAVVAGQRVRAGDVLGRCGNSGNSSEPHLHVQLMDHPNPVLAAGLPFALPALATPERPTGLPPDGEHLDTGEAATERRAPRVAARASSEAELA